MIITSGDAGGAGTWLENLVGLALAEKVGAAVPAPVAVAK